MSYQNSILGPVLKTPVHIEAKSVTDIRGKPTTYVEQVQLIIQIFPKHTTKINRFVCVREAPSKGQSEPPRSRVLSLYSLELHCALSESVLSQL